MSHVARTVAVCATLWLATVYGFPLRWLLARFLHLRLSVRDVKLTEPLPRACNMAKPIYEWFVEYLNPESAREYSEAESDYIDIDATDYYATAREAFRAAYDFQSAANDETTLVRFGLMRESPEDGRAWLYIGLTRLYGSVFTRSRLLYASGSTCETLPERYADELHTLAASLPFPMR